MCIGNVCATTILKPNAHNYTKLAGETGRLTACAYTGQCQLDSSALLYRSPIDSKSGSVRCRIFAARPDIKIPCQNAKMLPRCSYAKTYSLQRPRIKLADEDIIIEWSLEAWQLGRVNNCRTGNRKNTQPSPDQTSTRPFIKSDHFKGPYRSWSDDDHICI